MPYTIRPLNGAEALAIASWHYKGPYAFYDVDQDPEDLAELLDPTNWGSLYYAALDAQGQLAGYFSFQREGHTLVVGLGLRPDLTGQGLGLDFVLAGLAFAQAHYAPQRFRLNVATFNQRAIRVYERAGFVPVRVVQQRTKGGDWEFLEMEREAGNVKRNA